MEKVIRPYEAVIILNSDVSEETQKQLFRKNKEIITQHEGSVNHVDTWGKRNLANMIGKARKGIFFHTTFMADNKAVAELERTMRINENVLRFMHVRLEDGTSLPAHVEQFKKELADGVAKERDRELKIQQKKAARAQQAAMN